MIVRISAIVPATTIDDIQDTEEKLLIIQECDDFHIGTQFLSDTIKNWEKGSYSEYKNLRIEITE